LAYLLGLEGLALLRAFAGEYDREFTEARLREVSALMESVLRSDDGACAQALTTAEGYRSWAATYDLQANQLIDLEQPLVREILNRLPPGTALDAACGTGRHASYLASLGHKVIGVDSSIEMLTAARGKRPKGDFRLADLHYLPLPDNQVDVVVCALALTHVPDLRPVLSEFARVLRPGGHLVISDSRGFFGDITLPLVKTGPDGTPGYIPNRNRLTSEYLVTALSLGLEVLSCAEPRHSGPLVDEDGIPPTATGPAMVHVPGAPPNIWALHSWATAATNAAYRDNPAVIVWHFQTRRYW
jgi:SAM-dependent methyltransferase